MRKTVFCWALVSLLGFHGSLHAYPLDADESGIRRLLGYRQMQERTGGAKLPTGARLPLSVIRLQLLDRADWDLRPEDRDPRLQAAVESVFRARDPSYGITLIDISDPERIRWAGLREDRRQAPGSVGKVLCMAALFDGLRRAFPDIADRQKLLKEHMVEGGDWVISDAHKVPKFDTETGSMSFSVVNPKDRFTLGEWVDHMISPSANAAGAVVWKEAMLLRAFGGDYPPSPEQEAAFFKDTPKSNIKDIAQEVINDALVAAGLNPDELRVGNFWTRVGKQRVPGIGGSRATPRELARFLLRLEQGRLVDLWSSLEMKRYLYMTKRRYRYVFAPELARSAVFFKSGSLYRCRPEPDFKCGKYMGNVENAMNSIAIIESPAEPGPLQKRYLVALTSNVLRRNSAWDHSRLGAAVEEMIRSQQTVRVREEGSAQEIKSSGTSD